MYNWISKYYNLLLSLPRERSTRCNIVRVYLSVWRYKSVDFFWIAHPIVFMNAIVYATWHISSSRCYSGAPMPLSHLAIGQYDIDATKVQCRILCFSVACYSVCCQEPETTSVHCAANDPQPGGCREYRRWLAILQNILDMKYLSHLQVTRELTFNNSYGYDLWFFKNAPVEKGSLKWRVCVAFHQRQWSPESSGHWTNSESSWLVLSILWGYRSEISFRGLPAEK